MRHVLQRVLALVAATVVVMAAAAPAQADPQRLMLGLDQAGPFTESLATPLFTGTYVPGSASSSFYVKNESPSTTRATIALVPKTAVNDFERSLSFAATVGGEVGAPIPLQVTGKKKNECRTIVTGPTIGPGGVQRIDVTMNIASDLSTSAMNQPASFAFVVTLSQVTTKGKVDVCGPQSPNGSARVLGAQATVSPEVGLRSQEITATPRNAAAVVGVASALLLAGGLALVAARRRRRNPA